MSVSPARGPRRSGRATRARISPESLLSDESSSSSSDSSSSSAPRKRRARASAGSAARGRKRTRAERPAVAATASKAKGRSAAAAAGTQKRAPARRGPRTLNAAQSRADLHIHDDNVLFNAVVNTASALQSTAEDWVIAYQSAPGAALAQLVTFILRSSACNESIDGDQAQDLDGVVDTIDDIQEIFKRDSPAAYPLISRTPQFKKFRTALAELLRRIFASAADADILQDDVLLPTLAAWLSAGSSSPLRSFRHTSTVAALLSVTSLLAIEADAQLESVKLNKQVAAEKAKARINKSRLAEQEARLAETNAVAVSVSEYIKDMISGVFVHRYRDTDPVIRADCIHELGLWMVADPEKFLRPAYFTYLGLVMADEDVRVRLTAINALASLYGPNPPSSVQQFTQRFLSRLLEMARGDVDLAVRCRTLGLLAQINEHDLLETEEQDEVALQIFSAEPKIRIAVAPFVISVLLRNADIIKEAVIAKRVEQTGHGSWNEDDENFAIFKSFSQVLSQGAQIDARISSSIPGVSADTSRVGLAIEALWEEASNLSNWPGVIDLILHAQPDEARAAEGRDVDMGSTEPEAGTFAITRVQEATLLEAMPTMIAKAQEEAETDPEMADSAPDLGLLLSAIPRLLSRHRTDSAVELRILALVSYIPAGRLAEGDENADRDALWSELRALLMRLNEPALLAKAAAGMQRVSSATASGATDRMTALAEELIQQLRDTAAERDMETATLNENDIYTLQTACARLQAVLAAHPAPDFFGSEGDATPAWDILYAVVSRGRLGYDEEAKLVSDALKTLEYATLWLLKDAAYEQDRAERIRTALIAYFNLVQEFSRTEDTAAAARVTAVAVDALITYLILRESVAERDGAADTAADDPAGGTTTARIVTHVLHTALGSYEQDDSIPSAIRKTTDEAVEAFAPRRASASGAGAGEVAAQEAAGSNAEDSDLDGEEGPVRTQQQPEDAEVVVRKAELAHAACAGLGHLVRLAHLGIIRVHKLAPAVAQYGRITPAYDALVKSAVEVARSLSIHRYAQEDVVAFVENALKMAQDAVTENEVAATVVQRLARLLSGALVLRGRSLSIVGGVQGAPLIGLHERLLGAWLDTAAAAEKSGHKRIVNRTLPVFRVLAHLLAGARPRDAIAIKLALDSKLTALAPSLPQPNTRAMEHVQIYERRLVSIASRLNLDKIAPEPATATAATPTHEAAHTATPVALAEQTVAVADTESPRPQAQGQKRPRPRAAQPAQAAQPEPDMEADELAEGASAYDDVHMGDAGAGAQVEAEVEAEDEAEADATAGAEEGTHHIEPTGPNRKRVRRA